MTCNINRTTVLKYGETILNFVPAAQEDLLPDCCERSIYRTVYIFVDQMTGNKDEHVHVLNQNVV